MLTQFYLINRRRGYVERNVFIHSGRRIDHDEKMRNADLVESVVVSVRGQDQVQETGEIYEVGGESNNREEVETTDKRNWRADFIKFLKYTPWDGSDLDSLGELLREKMSEKHLMDRDDNGNTVLHDIAVSGNAILVGALLQAPWVGGAINIELVNACNKEGRTALHLAARTGDGDTVEKLVQFGADKNVRDKNGTLPFHQAASSDSRYLDIAVVLSSLEPDEGVDAKTEQGRTALHLAAGRGTGKAVGWLLKREASVEEGDMQGNTPLHYALLRPKPIDSYIVQQLIESGAPLCRRNHARMMPVSYLLRWEDIPWNHIDRRNVVGVEEADAHGRNILHYAAKLAHPSFVEEEVPPFLTWVLKLAGWDAFIKGDEDWNTPLHYAAESGNASMARALLKHGGEMLLFYGNKDRMKPVVVALVQQQKDLFELLLRDSLIRLSDISYGLGKKMQEEMEGKMQKGELDALATLPIYPALHLGNDLAVTFLLGKSPTLVNMADHVYRRTSLHWAVHFGRGDLVEALVAREDVQLYCPDREGTTAVQYAFETGDVAIQLALLKRGDWKAYEERLYRDRQVHVDAANAVLVGAALIASVTFASWLQPPLGLTPYFQRPITTPGVPPGNYESYAALAQHKALRAFWVCNAFSFFFAMAAVLVGSGAVLPMPQVYIADAVKRVRQALVAAAAFVVSSSAFVLGAFATAGYVVLPPIFKYQANIIIPIILGGMMCSAIIVWFFRRLYLCFGTARNRNQIHTTQETLTNDQLRQDIRVRREMPHHHVLNGKQIEPEELSQTMLEELEKELD